MSIERSRRNDPVALVTGKFRFLLERLEPRQLFSAANPSAALVAANQAYVANLNATLDNGALPAKTTTALIGELNRGISPSRITRLVLNRSETLKTDVSNIYSEAAGPRALGQGVGRGSASAALDS